MKSPEALIRQAMQIANRAVMADIESECDRVLLDARLWFDTTPMLDPNEHAPVVIDMAREALDFALEIGLVVTHPTLPRLVRKTQETL